MLFLTLIDSRVVNSILSISIQILNWPSLNSKTINSTNFLLNKLKIVVHSYSYMELLWILAPVHS